jgi:preprotein translocase SecE subunit
MTTANPKLVEQPGFLRPYKPGQGFWTRLGTGLGAALIILFTVYFLYSRLPTWIRTDSSATLTEQQLEELRADPAVRVYSADAVEGGFDVAWETALLHRSSMGLYILLTVATIGLALLAWWLINRQKHAEFLIATDGEMKKVNWTSRRELIGSTKVVVFFMFFIAAVLFFYDVVFGYFFFMLDVLKIAPLTS